MNTRTLHHFTSYGFIALDRSQNIFERKEGFDFLYRQLLTVEQLSKVKISATFCSRIGPVQLGVYLENGNFSVRLNSPPHTATDQIHYNYGNYYSYPFKIELCAREASSGDGE